MLLNKAFWKDKKIFLTGHTGFVGSWLALWLSRWNAKVFGYALTPNTDPNLFSILRIKDQIHSILGDIRDNESLSEAFQKAQPDIIIHLAAQPLVRYSYTNPKETFETNVLGTVNVLECFRKSHDAKVFLNVTTDKCYKNNEWVWGYRENDQLGGHDPYSCSKACSELVSECYRSSYFSEYNSNQNKVIATARAGNILGGGDWSMDRLVPDFMRSVSDKKTIKVRNPNAMRPWQHVLDAISGYLCLIEKLWGSPKKYSGAWNFGPQTFDCKPVEYIIQKLCDLWPDNVNWEVDADIQPKETHFLQLDISKAKKYLNWSSKMGIDETLERTIKWYLALKKQSDMVEYSIEEIETYNHSQIEALI